MNAPATAPVYFDMCALQRPLDTAAGEPDPVKRAALATDLANDAAALAALIPRVQWISSPMHALEITDCTDPQRVAYVRALLASAPIQMGEPEITLPTLLRYADITRGGIAPRDAVHLLYAELRSAVLVTVDTKFRTRASAIANTMVYSLQQAVKA